MPDTSLLSARERWGSVSDTVRGARRLLTVSSRPGTFRFCVYHIESNRHEWIYVLVLLLMASALRLYRLSAQSIWVDEMLTLSSSGVTAPLHPIDIFDNLHGPLHSLLVFLWTKVAGQGEFALRFPSVVFSVLSLYAIWRLIRKLTNPRVAFVALAIMTVSPFHVWYAQEARNYSMLLFFAAMSFDSFLELIAEPRRAVFGRYVLFTFAAFLCNMSMAFAVLVQDIVFFFWPRKLSFRNLVAAHVLLVLLLSPWLYDMFQRVEFHRLVRTEPYAAGEFLRGQTTFTPLALPYTFFVFSTGYSMGPSLRELHESTRMLFLSGHLRVVLFTAISFALPCVLGILSLRNKKKLLWLLLIWLAVPLGIVSLFAVKNFKPFNPRYVMVAYPAYVLLLARGLRWPDHAHLSRKLLSGLLAAMVLASTVLSLSNLYHSRHYWKDDFRSAGATLDGQLQERDVVFTEGTYEPLIYYCRTPVTFHSLFPNLISDEAVLRDFLREKSAGAHRVWLVTARLWDLDPERKVLRLFEQYFIMEKESNFEGVDLFLFRKREESQT